MRILVHDYAGHPFQVQLSRALAARGHTVLHAYCKSIQTPRGALLRQPDDSDGFHVQGIGLETPIQKYSLLKRRLQDMKYGRLVLTEINRFGPDVVLSANTPLEPQEMMLRGCKAKGIKFVYWVQDLLGVGLRRALGKRMPIIGPAVGICYMWLERYLLRRSDELVLISEDFRPLTVPWVSDPSRVHVIENWAPLNEISVLPKSNPWSLKHGLADKLCILYSGTLGLKHNPELLLRVARYFQHRPDVRVVVISMGIGAEWLRREKAKHGIENLIVMPYQPFEQLPAVLASATVLVAILEPDAGVFSVPSKVLTYLCSRRPLLLSVPLENLAARLVDRAQAGLLAPTDDGRAFVQAAERIIQDESLREQLAANARAFAEERFDIERISTAFERILRR